MYLATTFIKQEAIKHLSLTLICLMFAATVGAAEHQTKNNRDPLAVFIGKWQISEKGFSIVWDGKNEHKIDLSGQISTCQRVNTDFSMLCAVETKHNPKAQKGHMFWTRNSKTGRIHWLSHFTPNRHGLGEGHADENGNLTFKITFADEQPGSYRIYTWRWQSRDRYEMLSVQYTQNGEPTGNWYGGEFVRIVDDSN